MGAYVEEHLEVGGRDEDVPVWHIDHTTVHQEADREQHRYQRLNAAIRLADDV